MSGETCLESGCGSGVPPSSFLAAFEVVAAAPPLLPLLRVLSGGRLDSLGTCSSTGGTLGPLLLPLRSSLTGPPPPPVAGTGVVPRDLAGGGGALAGESAAAEVLRVDLRWLKAGGGDAAAAAESGVVVRRRERSEAIQAPTSRRERGRAHSSTKRSVCIITRAASRSKVGNRRTPQTNLESLPAANAGSARFSLLNRPHTVKVADCSV